MRYAYYARLRPRQKAIYRRSDEIAELPLPQGADLRPLVEALKVSLALGDRAAVQRSAARLAAGVLMSLGLPAIQVKVLDVRPSRSWGELHGLYEPAERGHRAAITLWMRTARHKKTVAFRTFLRTLLHEVCHHLDYALLGLEDSFHTEGFFRRESSLFRQLVDDDATVVRPRGKTPKAPRQPTRTE